MFNLAPPAARLATDNYLFSPSASLPKGREDGVAEQEGVGLPRQDDPGEDSPARIVAVGGQEDGRDAFV